MAEILTPFEIEHLKHDTQNWFKNMKDPIWIKAFKFYNTYYPHLGMNCPPCYIKVAKFHLDFLKSIEEAKKAILDSIKNPK